jgi:chemotaxis protein CheD
MGMLVVGISDMKIASPPDTLITYALGSCVGICLLDAVTRTAGLAHIMLPEGKAVSGDAAVCKFADTAIPELIKRMEKKGASRARLKAKIAGGAQMFEPSGGGNSAMWQIGERNVKTVVAILQRFAIPILAKDVLLNYGRTVTFDPATGIMSVKAVNKPTKEL